MNFPSFCHRACGRTAAGPVVALYPIVQRVRRQHAARAAPLLPCVSRAPLAAERSRERQREAETEGKIKGAARNDAPSQCACGFDTAQRVEGSVPCQGHMPLSAMLGRVPFPNRCAASRWSLRHGRA